MDRLLQAIHNIPKEIIEEFREPEPVKAPEKEFEYVDIPNRRRNNVRN